MKKLMVYLLMLILCSFIIFGTTFIINDTTNGIKADHYVLDNNFVGLGFQIRFNITEVPQGKNIEKVLFSGNISEANGVDNDTVIKRIKSQTWTEGTCATSFDNITTDKLWSSVIASTRTTLDVTTQFSVDYDLNNNFTSFFIYDPDSPMSESDFYGCEDDGNLAFGALEGIIMVINDRETGTPNSPYLNITYSEAPPEPIIRESPRFSIKSLSRFIIKSAGRFYMKK